MQTEGLYQLLSKKEEEYVKMLWQVEKSLKNAPPGSLRISCKNHSPRYYYHIDKNVGTISNSNVDNMGKSIKGNISNSIMNNMGKSTKEGISDSKMEDSGHSMIGSKSEIYLNKGKGKLINQLAQKDYDARLEQVLKKRIKQLQAILKDYKDNEIEMIEQKLHCERKKLIKPIVLSTTQYVAEWEAKEYCKKEFWEETPEIYTEKGERVRSKSEKIIADKFFIMGIPYRYEEPVFLKGMGTIHPDFKVLNVRTKQEFYWEHLGKMDDEEYAGEALFRIEIYEKNHILLGRDLIVTYETKDRPLNIRLVEEKIREFLL